MKHIVTILTFILLAITAFVLWHAGNKIFDFSGVKGTDVFQIISSILIAYLVSYYLSDASNKLARERELGIELFDLLQKRVTEYIIPIQEFMKNPNDDDKSKILLYFKIISFHIGVIENNLNSGLVNNFEVIIKNINKYYDEGKFEVMKDNWGTPASNFKYLNFDIDRFYKTQQLMINHIIEGKINILK